MASLLDEEEWHELEPLLRKGILEIKAFRAEGKVPLDEVPFAECYADALDKYLAMPGAIPVEPGDLWHHRLSSYGQPCPNCGRLLRSEKAVQCHEC